MVADSDSVFPMSSNSNLLFLDFLAFHTSNDALHAQPSTHLHSSSSSDPPSLDIASNTQPIIHTQPDMHSASSPSPPLHTFRRSSRPKKPPTYLRDFHCYMTTTTEVSPTSEKVLYPLSHHLTYSKLFPKHKHFVVSISAHEEPKNYNQVDQFDCWRQAM